MKYKRITTMVLVKDDIFRSSKPKFFKRGKNRAISLLMKGITVTLVRFKLDRNGVYKEIWEYI